MCNKNRVISANSTGCQFALVRTEKISWLNMVTFVPFPLQLSAGHRFLETDSSLYSQLRGSVRFSLAKGRARIQRCRKIRAKTDLEMALSLLHVLGGTMQALAYGFLGRHDMNTSCTTRFIGTFVIFLLLSTGTVIAAVPPSRQLAILIPIVRADLTLILLARLVKAVVWASRLTRSDVLYNNEVYPLQVAAMIWNDCQPIAPLTRAEDERSMLVDLLLEQRELWRPAPPDSFVMRALRFPLYIVLEASCSIVGAVEAVVSQLSTYVVRGMRNLTPVSVQGEQREIMGHTLLVSDHQLKWIQCNMMRGGDILQVRETRRVAIRALHIANLLEHGGYMRLHEHSAGDHAMSEYYSAIQGNDVVKTLLSKADALSVLSRLKNGNSLQVGSSIPRQILWARIIVGCLAGLRGRVRWRGPVAAAVFTVAQQNLEQFGASINRTAINRHVYTVLRRWLVDWMMFIWWELDVPEIEVEDPDTFFERLHRLWTHNLVHNTLSLPHALGELASSTPRQPDVDGILSWLLGVDWELWLQQTPVVSGTSVSDAIVASGEWQCAGREVTVADRIHSNLYRQMRLRDLIAIGQDAPIGDQARAALAGRILGILTTRVRNAWALLPRRLYDEADSNWPDAEY